MGVGGEKTRDQRRNVQRGSCRRCREVGLRCSFLGAWQLTGKRRRSRWMCSRCERAGEGCCVVFVAGGGWRGVGGVPQEELVERVEVWEQEARERWERGNWVLPVPYEKEEE